MTAALQLRRASFALLVFLPGVGLVACGDDDPSGPETLEVEVLASGGSGQFAAPAATLDRPFEVHVRSSSDHKPRAGVTVEWSIVEGSGASLSERSSATNDLGKARTTLTLGPSTGLYRVRAEVPGAPGSGPEFWARAVEVPVLTRLPGENVAPGDTVVLEGRNFIPEVDQVVVTFDGIRGRALSGDETSLRVRVPSCLPSGSVEVVVALGELKSDPGTMSVAGEGPAAELDPGQAVTVDDPDALSCLRLPRSGTARYLAAVTSTSALGAASFDYHLVLRVGGGSLAVGEDAGVASIAWPGGSPTGTLQGAWDARVRRMERRAVEETLPGARRPRVAGPSRVPAVGDERQFSVLNGSGGFDEVNAVARYVGERSVIYVDRRAPEPGFDSTDLAFLAGEFDDPIHPTVTGVYGEESDLDGNGRVVVLFTPTVNELTEPGGDGGFVGGFFYGVDLLKDREGSNGGEVFYALVPDSAGEFGDPRGKSRVMATVPAILAHEFQHMVHFNQRVLRLGASSTDALWLSEALATSAEDLVADAYQRRGDDDRSWIFREGNYIRAVRFLEDPGGVSLVVSAGSGTLKERGAGWLFLRYLRGRTGGDDVLGGLTRSTATGVANVEARTGLSWSALVLDWSSALYLDGTGAPVPDVLLFRNFDLREEISRVNGGFPLQPPVRGGGDADLVRTVRASAVDHVLLEPRASGGLAVNLAGPGGGPLEPTAGLRLRLVRIR